MHPEIFLLVKSSSCMSSFCLGVVGRGVGGVQNHRFQLVSNYCLQPQLRLALRMEPAFLAGSSPYSSLTGKDGKSARERNQETVFSHK